MMVAERSRRADMLPVVREVARLLGNGWTCDERADEGKYDHLVTVRHTDGRAFTVNGAHEGPGKWRIYGQWPNTPGKNDGHENARWAARALDKGTEPPRIAFSVTKTPKQMAADIVRRFMPAYTAIYAKAMEVRESTMAAEAGQHQTAERLAAVAGETLRGDNKTRIYLPSDGSAYGDIDVDYGGKTCRMELRSVPPEMAEQIIRIIRAKAK